MTSQTQSSSYGVENRAAKPDALLRGALRFDAVFSGAAAILLILGGATIAEFVGLITPESGISGATIFSILGISFIFWSALHWFAARSHHIDLRIARGVMIFDFVWVAASWALLVTNALALNTAGNWILMLQADVVLVIAIAKFIGMRRLR